MRAIDNDRDPAWRVIGIDLAFAKGQWGDSVNWIGAKLSIESCRTLAVTIVQSRLDELAELCEQFRTGNTVSLRRLRSFAGKCQSMAAVLYTWRPFVHMLYGAIYAPQCPALPNGMLYTKQIDQPVSWIVSFLKGHEKGIVRVMDVDTHYRRGDSVDITADASPYGMGSILSINGRPVEYFAIATSSADAQTLGLELAHDSSCQQAFEALVLLISLRHWKYHWANRRCCIHVRGDNIAALSLICKMQPHSPSLGIIARELALDIADSIYEPQLVSHVPGIANVASDALSRKYQPGVQFRLPHILEKCLEVHPAPRTPAWWRALETRPSHSASKGVSFAPVVRTFTT